jgi:hypothetical protein
MLRVGRGLGGRGLETGGGDIGLCAYCVCVAISFVFVRGRCDATSLPGWEKVRLFSPDVVLPSESSRTAVLSPFFLGFLLSCHLHLRIYVFISLLSLFTYSSSSRPSLYGSSCGSDRISAFLSLSFFLWIRWMELPMNFPLIKSFFFKAILVYISHYSTLLCFTLLCVPVYSVRVVLCCIHSGVSNLPSSDTKSCPSVSGVW